MAVDAIDLRFMRAALALARRGQGRTAPNPAVAALVVDPHGAVPVIVGRGHTAPGGRPHAEARALAHAGAAARGATLYVTLEPCAQRSVRDDGLSCSERILASGIARVVIAASDPSPFAAGIGTQRLRDAGVAVVSGVLGAEARAQNLGHIRRVVDHRPCVQLKLAQTADGFAARLDRRPLAITGEASRATVHRLRSLADALITGIDTVLADDPRLDVRLPGMANFSPLRVVLDSTGRMPQACRLLETAAQHPVLIATAAPALLAARFAGRMGVEILGVPLGPDGHLDLAAMLGALAARGTTRVMVEAGPVLADAFAKAGLIDEIVLLTGPDTLGAGLKALSPALSAAIAKAGRGDDVLLGPDRLQVLTVRD